LSHEEPAEVDLLSLARRVWRYRIPAGIVTVLTLLACARVVFMVPPTYDVTTHFVLLYPPPAPTEEQLRQHPELGRISTDNPFLRFTDSSVVVQIVSRRMADDQVRNELAAAGADKNYTVEPSNRYGLSSPILDVTASGASESTALKASRLIEARLVAELRAIQAARGVDPYYMITAYPADRPDRAVQRFSSKLRALVAVLALGGFALLLTLSTLQALDQLRAERRRARLAAAPPAAEEAEAQPKGVAERASEGDRASHGGPAAGEEPAGRGRTGWPGKNRLAGEEPAQAHDTNSDALVLNAGDEDVSGNGVGAAPRRAGGAARRAGSVSR